MADELQDDAKSNSVSPARRWASAAILVLLLIVLTIEMRAGAGHFLTGRAFKAAAPKGVFSDTNVPQMEQLLYFSPSRTVVGEAQYEYEYRYQWYSLLRPIFSRPAAAYYVAVGKLEDQIAYRYSEQPPPEESPRHVRRRSDSSAGREEAMGKSRQRGSRQRPAGPEPLLTVLDSDEDGELSADEISRAPFVLEAVDVNMDGVVTLAELPQQDHELPQRRRPELESESASEPSEPPQNTTPLNVPEPQA